MYGQVHIRPPIAEIVLDYQPKRNALTEEVAQMILDGIREAESQRCVVGVLRAEGPVFCSGGDTKVVAEFAAHRLAAADPSGVEVEQPSAAQRSGQRVRDAISAVASSSLYWIASVQGPSLGAGLTLMCACPTVIAVRDAWFSIPEVSFGVFPGELMRALVPLIGARPALEMARTARRVSADAALQMGLISAVVNTHRDLNDATTTAAETLAAKNVFAREAVQWWGAWTRS